MDDYQSGVTPVRRGRGPARAGILGGAAFLVVAGVVATAAAAPAGSGTAGQGATADSARSSGTEPAISGGANAAITGAWTLAGDFAHLGGGPGRGGIFGDITVSAISGTNVSLQTDTGWTRTIAVTGDVEITKAGETIALADVAVGDSIRLRESRADDGTITLEGLVVVVPSVAGTVTAVDADSITIGGRGGLTREIATTGSTTYRLGDDSTTRAEVTVGDRIRALGTVSGEAFTATSVVIGLPHVAGEVTAKSASGFTLQLRDGTTVTVTVDSDTEYRLPGVDDPGLDDIDVGDRLGVAGTQDGTTIDAQVVGGGRGHGDGGRGGHGFGRGGWGGDAPAVPETPADESSTSS